MNLAFARGTFFVVLAVGSLLGCSQEAASLLAEVVEAGEGMLVPLQVPTLTASPSPVVADGKQSVKLTLALRDRYGNPLTGYAANFNSSIPSDGFSPSSTVRTGCNGNATLAFTPTAGAGVHSVRVKVGRTQRKVAVTAQCPGVFAADKNVIGNGLWYYNDILATDFDRDGFDDLATNGSGYALSVALGYGNSFFQTGTMLQVPNLEGRSFIANDFNRDGNIDFAACNGGNSVRVSLGNARVITSQVDYASNNGPVYIVAADVNRDGNLDLIGANTGANTLTVLLGDGNGALLFGSHVATLRNPSYLTTVDVNNDGNLDVVVTNNSVAGQFAVHLGAGSSYLRSPIIYNMNSLMANPAGIVAADFNRDGAQDLFITGINYCAYYTGNGNANRFNTSTLYSPGYNWGGVPINPVVADFNNDSILDAMWPATWAGTAVALGSLSGYFSAPTTIPTNNWVTSVAVTDVNKDGLKDFVTIETYGLNVHTFLNKGAGTFGLSPNTAFTHSQMLSASSVDMNRDGNLDVVGVGIEGSIFVALGDGHGALPVATGWSVGTGPVGSVVADFNSDGLWDAASVMQNGNNVTILFGDGNGALANAATVPVGNYPSGIAAADFNGDGKADLAVTNTNSNTLTILFDRGGVFNNPNTFTTALGPQGVAAADVNNDGLPDVVVTNYNSASISVLINQPGGPLQSAVNFSVGVQPRTLVLKDFNNDSKLDAIVTTGPGNVYFLAGSGVGTFSTATLISSESNGSAMASADFNQDGNWDLAIPYIGNDSIYTLLGKGDGTFRTPTNYRTTVATGPSSVATGDFDNDGFPDAAISLLGGLSFHVILNAKCAQ